MHGFRTPKYKLIHDLHNSDRNEFYDLVNDPNESKNLIRDQKPEIQTAIIALSEKLNQRLTQSQQRTIEETK